MTIDTFARMAPQCGKIGLFSRLLIAHGLEPDGAPTEPHIR